MAPYDHVVDSIRRLKQMGLKIAVFSNKPHLNAIKVVETIFGKGTFDHIQGQADRIPMKPDPAGVFEILRIFGVNKDAVGVCWGFRPREELEKYGADALLEDPSQIAELAEEKLHTH